MEDNSGYDEQPSGPAAIIEAVKKFGIGKVLLIVIILAAAAWFFVLAPKPGSVNVVISAIDSNEKIEGVQVDLTPSGQKTITKFTSGSGSARFDNIPSGADISLDITPPDAYKLSADAETSFTLASAESKTASIDLVRKAELTVQMADDSLALGTGCKTTVPVTVKNDGDAAFDVQLVGDGALKGLLETDSKNVPAQGTQTFDVALTAPAKKGSAKGSIRVQYTDASASFSIDAGEPEQLRVGPSSFSDRVQPGEAVKKQFTLENTGRATEARDLKAELTGDFVQIGATATFSDELPLKPKEKKILTLELNAPGNAGQSVGVLIVSSACQRLQVPLQLDVEEPRS